jgi:hypothetical protein
MQLSEVRRVTDSTDVTVRDAERFAPSKHHISKLIIIPSSFSANEYRRPAAALNWQGPFQTVD